VIAILALLLIFAISAVIAAVHWLAGKVDAWMWRHP
jgi:hypothetical protein